VQVDFFADAQVQLFSPVSTITLSTLSGLVSPSQMNPFFHFRGACGRVWVSLLYIFMNCFLTFSGYIILYARQGGFFLSIQGV